MAKKKVLQLSKGFYGRAKNCIKIARMRVEKALQHAYKRRRVKKRDYRKLWILRINAGVRCLGMNYNRFIHGLQKSQIDLNRKMLSELARHEPFSFRSVVDQVRILNNITPMQYATRGHVASVVTVNKLVDRHLRVYPAAFPSPTPYFYSVLPAPVSSTPVSPATTPVRVRGVSQAEMRADKIGGWNLRGKTRKRVRLVAKGRAEEAARALEATKATAPTVATTKPNNSNQRSRPSVTP